jgi:hypothetical protein
LLDNENTKQILLKLKKDSNKNVLEPIKDIDISSGDNIEVLDKSSSILINNNNMSILRDEFGISRNLPLNSIIKNNIENNDNNNVVQPSINIENIIKSNGVDSNNSSDLNNNIQDLEQNDKMDVDIETNNANSVNDVNNEEQNASENSEDTSQLISKNNDDA